MVQELVRVPRVVVKKYFIGVEVMVQIMSFERYFIYVDVDFMWDLTFVREQLKVQGLPTKIIDYEEQFNPEPQDELKKNFEEDPKLFIKDHLNNSNFQFFYHQVKFKNFRPEFQIFSFYFEQILHLK